MIPVKHEDVEELKRWGMGLEHVVERCVLCNMPTRYWHLPTNSPCCEGCAKTHKVADLKAPGAGVAPCDGGKHG